MKYKKPAVLLVSPACGTIQGVSKTGVAMELTEKPTVSAYEADD